MDRYRKLRRVDSNIPVAIIDYTETGMVPRVVNVPISYNAGTETLVVTVDNKTITFDARYIRAMVSE